MIGNRTLRHTAGALFVLCAVLILTTAVLTVIELLRHELRVDQNDFASGFVFLADGLVFAGVGALIARQQPRNVIGWLLLAAGTFWAVGLALSTYADYGVNVNPGSVPAPALANAVVVWTWIPAVGLMATFVPLLFPDGHLLTPRWRWLAWLSAAVMVVLSLAFLTDPRAFADSSMEGVANPLGLDLGPSFRKAVEGLFVLFPLCMVASAVAAVLRFRRSRGVERLQMKWLTAAAAFFASFFGLMLLLGLVPAIHDSPSATAVINFVLPVTFILFPIAIGAAVLRYRLYEIDVVISRSLVFGALAAFITSVYIAIVVGVGHLLGGGGRPNLALSVVATAVVAVAFQPLRGRLQRSANRMVYGRRASPYEVLSEFADRMGGAYDATELLPVMARTACEGLSAAEVDVWLRQEPGFARRATWPPTPGAATGGPVEVAALADVDSDRVAAVRDRDETLGAIVVTKRSGEALSPVEERLLDDLAAQAGPVLRNVRLIQDLRGSRERLVTNQDEERRRLERNLHDGAQQSLVAMMLMLRLLRSRLGDAEEEAGSRLDRAADGLQRSIDDLRELARGIYPVTLSERGLGAAFSSLAERSPVPVAVDDRVQDRLPQGVERTLYFVAADLLAAAAEHPAEEITLRLEPGDASVTLEVRAGPDAAGALGKARLRGLLDRVAVVDGSLDVLDLAAGGRVVCTVPIPPGSTSGSCPPGSSARRTAGATR